MLELRRFSNLVINPLRPELNPSAQRCLTRFFYLGFCFLNRACGGIRKKIISKARKTGKGEFHATGHTANKRLATLPSIHQKCKEWTVLLE
jgi:hypothetical protein